jgi:DNA polymerase I-like protein with 3'-5' exonuclease and polymerase domains
MRCTYNLAGTETFRFSSSEDAFGFGTNLQNIPKGDE